MEDSFRKAMELGSAWLDYSFRHRAFLIKRLGSMDPKNRKEVIEEFARELAFVKRVDLNPAFHRFVQRELENHNKEIKELAFLIMLDILRKDPPTPKEAEKKGGHYVSRHRRRFIRDIYPEIFFPYPNVKKKRMKLDKRMKPFRCIFSHEFDPRKDHNSKEAIMLMAIEELASERYQEKFQPIMEIHANLRAVDPEEIQCLYLFWEYLESLVKKDGFIDPSSENKWIEDQILNRGKAVEILHYIITLAVALRWFRSKKSKQQEILLSHNYRLSYNKDDAFKAVHWSYKWYQDSGLVFDQIRKGAYGYNAIGKPNVEGFLFEECLEQLELDKEVEALCHHNIADSYRNLNKPRKMLIELKKTLQIFEEMKSAFDIGITWSYLGEAYSLLDDEKRSEKAFSKARKILKDNNIEPLKSAEGFLEMADCGQRLGDTDLERIGLESGIDVLMGESGIIENDYFSYLNQRLLHLNMGMSTFKAEQKPGMLKHPKKIGVTQFRPSMYF